MQNWKAWPDPEDRSRARSGTSCHRPKEALSKGPGNASSLRGGVVTCLEDRGWVPASRMPSVASYLWELYLVGVDCGARGTPSHPPISRFQSVIWQESFHVCASSSWEGRRNTDFQQFPPSPPRPQLNASGYCVSYHRIFYNLTWQLINFQWNSSMQLSWFTGTMPRTTQKNKVAIIAVTMITSTWFLYILSRFILGIKNKSQEQLQNSISLAFDNSAVRFLPSTSESPVNVSLIFCKWVLLITADHQQVHSAPTLGRASSGYASTCSPYGLLGVVISTHAHSRVTEPHISGT